jgi:CRISPR-associated endonuclease/helicase Cas3
MLSLKDTYSQMKKKGFFGKNVRERKCLDEALEIIEGQISEVKSTLTFIQLPPGYGKTAIPYALSLWALSSNDIYLERSIHVLPLRSIVEDSLKRFKDGLEGIGLNANYAEKIAGAQCMFIHGSPFLQKNLAITTLDTFALLATKLPPTELRKIAHENSLGHFEIPRGALLSSAIVFDEAHLFLEERSKKSRERSLTAFITLITALLKLHIPVVLMTATLPNSWRQELKEWFIRREPKLIVRTLTYDAENFKDDEFDDEIKSNRMSTKFLSNDIDYVKEIMEASKSYERVLVVTNTIRRAKELYENLRECHPILLHAKFTQDDRENKLNVISDEKSKWICISTQVIEAGVDISAQVLFTDIAPPCSLIQRAGRCCRPSHEDDSDEGIVIVCTSKNAISSAYEIYENNVIDRFKEILKEINNNFNWHFYPEYMSMLEKVYSEYKFNLVQRMDFYQYQYMLKILLDPYWDSRDAFNLLLSIGSLTRDKPLITGIICENEDLRGVIGNFSEYKGNVIPLEFNDVYKIARHHKIKLLTTKGEKDFDVRIFSNEEIFYERLLYGDIIAIHIPPEIYDKERGLKI